jgi:preprotein translocase subunit SecG
MEHIQLIIQVLLHTTHHRGVTSYNSSYSCYFIQLIIQVLLHTTHHTGVTSYNSSYRCYFIQLIIQVLLHTTHHTGVTSYNSSYRCYFIINLRSKNNQRVYFLNQNRTHVFIVFSVWTAHLTATDIKN